jgi:CHAT domain-containing protein
LEGTAAAKAQLRRALAGRPAVVHLATHVLPAAERSGQALIALSLTPNGAELLDAGEIAAWDSRAGLVVLSGCNSGAGPAIPGTGLMGLTRSWLAAGAGAVAATHWPTPDGTGALLRSVYRHLRSDPGAGPAAALAKAQVEMLRAGGWRARPQYWGAYFVVGNQ